MVDVSQLLPATDRTISPPVAASNASIAQPEMTRAEPLPHAGLPEARVDRDESRLAIDLIPGLVWTAQPDGYIDFLNQWWCDYTGLALEQAVGWGWQAAVCPEDLPGLMETWQKVLASRAAGEAVARLRRADGVDRWFLFRAVPKHDEAGTLIKWYGQTTDIDDRMRAEEALRRSEAYQAEAQRLSLTGSFSWHPHTGELIWSDETYRIYGYDNSIKPSLDLARSRLHPHDVALFNRTAEGTATGDKLEFAHRLQMPDGSIKYIQVVSRAVRDQAGQVIEYVGAVRDVTQHTRDEKALRRARLRALEARYTAIMEERTRLAREIHDTILQGFNGVTLLLLAAVGKVESPPDAILGLQHVLDLAEKTLGDARRAVWDLRAPSVVGDFEASLRTVAEQATRGTNLSLDFVTKGRPRATAPKAEAAALRIVEEAIANALRHASAQRVRVCVSYQPRRVRVSVRDDGRGFTVDPAFRAYGGHWGLLGMRERATEVNARLKIRSSPGAGTEIILSLR